MTYTPEQRRQLLNRLVAEDEDAVRLEQEFWSEKEKYERFVDRLPGFLRKKLYGYPTMCYHYHQRVLTLLCEQLRFPGEE